MFSWGSNSHGQLGLGKELPSQASPQRVRSLDGIPLAQVAAGGAHSFALSLSGTSFGWGSNNAGQLALSGDNVSGNEIVLFLQAIILSFQLEDQLCQVDSQRLEQ